MTPSRARALLDRHGLAPRKSDGQNFLVDPNTLRRIVAAADVGRDDHVVEVGPGLGAMTAPLVDVAAHVTAIELDAGLVGVLEEELGHNANLDIVHADAMDVDLDDLATAHDGPTRLVSNLPYNVATPLLMHWLSGASIPEAFLMVQREVADRWAASVGDDAHGAVSVKVALAATVSIELTIPRTVFLPVPNVDSVMVRVRRRDDALDPSERATITTVVDAGFRQRRKTLRNNLRRTWPAEGVVALRDVGIDPRRRAETLDVAEWTGLARALRRRGVAITPDA